MSINQEKFSNLNQARKSTHRSVSSGISQLLAHSMDAIKQQCYMRVDPDENGADQLVPVVTPDFIQTATDFNVLKERLDDMQAVAIGSMTVEDLITKYSVDLTEYSLELI